MDTLGGILSQLQQESIVFCHAELTAPWGFSKDRLDGAPFHAVISGTAWVGLDGGKTRIEMKPGDFLVLPHGDSHTLTAEPGTPAVSFTQVLKAQVGSLLWKPGGKRSGGPVRMSYGGGGEMTTLVSGVFAFVDRRRNPLVRTLPRVIHIRHGEGQSIWLETTLRYLAHEAEAATPGASAITAKLADILFIQAIRAHLALHPAETTGWLRGLTDPAIGQALALMHTSPESDWTVASLAREVGLSRAGFAARFKSLVGQGPIEYLTQWRMHQAAGLILAGNDTTIQVAEQVGYASSVAFAKAFKRWSGQSPAAYRVGKAGEK